MNDIRRRRGNSRRNKQAQRSPWGFIFGGALIGLVVGLFIFLPSLRASAMDWIKGQVTREFGAALGVVPDTSGKILLCMELDNSGSSTRTLTDARGNATPYRGRIADEAVRLSQLVLDEGSQLTDTMIWRLGAEEGRIYNGVNDELRLRSLLKEQFVNFAPDPKQGSNFAPALDAAYLAFMDYKRDHPKAILVITVGTDGGVTDIVATQKAATRLAKEPVLVFVHGILPKDRLWERTQYALKPLRAAGKLFDSNLTDFDIHAQRFRKALEKKGVVTTGMARRVATPVLPGSGPITAGGGSTTVLTPPVVKK